MNQIFTKILLFYFDLSPKKSEIFGKELQTEKINRY